jgi:TetR/AcrR family transcriptional repressor of nem operon
MMLIVGYARKIADVPPGLAYFLEGAVAAPRRHTSIFEDILRRSLSDRERKGCMIVNCALEVAPHDKEFRETIVETLGRLETFFLNCVERGQADGTITSAVPAVGLAQHLLGVLMGVRVLARVRPERRLLEGVINTALAFLDGP